MLHSIAPHLRHIAWIDVEASLWAVVMLVAGLGMSWALRGRLPLWRKGIWIGAMVAPVGLAILAVLLPRQTYALTDYLLPGESGRNVAGGTTWEITGLIPLAYGLWLGVNGLIEIGVLLQLRRILGSAQPVANPDVVEAYTRLAKAMRFARAPRLVQSEQVASPFIVAGVFGGLTIVLPWTLAEEGPAESLRAVLAHELAHARAGDPYVLRLVSVVRMLLPLTWLCGGLAARRSWEEAAEETGDLRAVGACGLSGLAYGRVLKEMACSSDGPRPAAVLGFSPALGGLGPEALRLIKRVRTLRLSSGWSEAYARGLGGAARALVMGSAVVFLGSQPAFMRLLDDPRGKVVAAASPQMGEVAAVKGKLHRAKDRVVGGEDRRLLLFEKEMKETQRLEHAARHPRTDKTGLFIEI